ncbi:MAG: hypothetical protein IKS48_08000 [Eubacterium sp.]|nr:hypothetical protein [Eubacterium sp.]
MHFDSSEYSGTDYFWKAMSVYIKTFTPAIKILLIGYTLLLLFILIKGNKKERLFFLVSLLILGIICLNPWMAWFLVEHFGFSLRYFRLFWVIPVSMGYTYFGIKIYKGFNSGWQRVLCYIFVLGLLGSSYYLVYQKSKTHDIYTGAVENTGLIPIPNIYRVEDDVIEACRLIEEDAGDEHALKKALYNRNVFLEIRTYDASILSMVQYPNEIPEIVNFEQALKEENWEGALWDLFKGKLGGASKELINPDTIRDVCINSGCEYIILSKNHKWRKKFCKNMTVLGEAGRFIIIKVE